VDFADDLRLGDFFASVKGDVIVGNNVEGVCALDLFVGARVVSTDALAEPAEFIGIGFAPYGAKYGVSAELFVVKGLARVVVEDRSGEFGWSGGSGVVAAGG